LQHVTETASPLSGLFAGTKIRPAPQRFFESWIDLLGGFLFCVVLPIPLYATGAPFSVGIGAAEQTILATAAAYVFVWYCGRRLDAFPLASPRGNLGYVVPIACLAYGLIGVLLLLFRSEYSRVQLAGSGGLTVVWMSAAAIIRGRYLVRVYAVTPPAIVSALPSVQQCRWLSLDEVERDAVQIDAIVADLDGMLPKQQVSALAAAAIAGVPVLDRRFVLESLTGRTPLGGLTPNEFGAVLPSRQYLVLRRAVELGLTVLALPLFLPLLAAVALAIRLDSPGPIFFLQKRAGRRGGTFAMIKFRTMFHGSAGPSFTLPGDARVTRVGAFLRRCRLDELPQFLNVLKGDMSWVGPRPEALVLEQEYLRTVRHFALRGIIRPGITGWSQIHQDEFSADEGTAKLEYDLYYLKHCSLWLDLRIILRTVSVVLRGSGAH
jgi:lipopolysaccharide/colanic/teichoic acid biosynthesis glycosyltransferase